MTSNGNNNFHGSEVSVRKFPDLNFKLAGGGCQEKSCRIHLIPIYFIPAERCVHAQSKYVSILSRWLSGRK